MATPGNPQTGDWQSIRTAPKDGTHILGFAPDAIEPRVFSVQWMNDEFHPEDAGWFDSVNSPGRAIDVGLTHWTPLPAEPRGFPKR